MANTGDRTAPRDHIEEEVGKQSRENVSSTMPGCIKLFPWPAPVGGELSEHSASADAPHPGVTPGVHVKENPGDPDKRTDQK